ncbi:MAG: phosphoribosylamine--glycine ligase [Actinomycetota bacterium]|nr:phosphoribosylamine--glycine ligase [Actinomycetota bacterium]
MKSVIVGSGGREHALAHVLQRDSDVTVTPGNPGIPNSKTTSPLELEADLFVIGPEEPLVSGLADELRQQGKVVFGPGADGAKLEGSKAWMKDLLVEANVPTAKHGTFTEEKSAIAFLKEMPLPYVIKTDGLAAGKGVLVTDSLGEAQDTIKSYLSGEAFGNAGRRIVIEEGIQGDEISILAVCDGEKAVALSPAQDFKRLLDNDEGPNTGGMGAYSPVPKITEQFVERIMKVAVQPTLQALINRGINYRGVLYAGIMNTANGPKILEYNVRFGDPEAQVVLPRLKTSLFELLFEAATGNITTSPEFIDETMVTVICASEGYPKSPITGNVIKGMQEARSIDGVEEVFCAGVAVNEDNELMTAGGRVLAVTGRGSTVTRARENAYRGTERITWEGLHKRKDIAGAVQ